jgi:hypothetical protein
MPSITSSRVWKHETLIMSSGQDIGVAIFNAMVFILTSPWSEISPYVWRVFELAFYACVVWLMIKKTFKK